MLIFSERDGQTMFVICATHFVIFSFRRPSVQFECYHSESLIIFTLQGKQYSVFDIFSICYLKINEMIVFFVNSDNSRRTQQKLMIGSRRLDIDDGRSLYKPFSNQNENKEPDIFSCNSSPPILSFKF